jgi:hypothetical protein
VKVPFLKLFSKFNKKMGVSLEPKVIKKPPELIPELNENKE